MIKLSQNKANEAKKLNTQQENLVFADLLTLGYSENDAFIISHPVEAAMNVQQQRSVRDGIVNSAKFKELVESRRRSNAMILEFTGDVNDIELIDPEQTAKEILRIAKQLPLNSKERGEMFMKYADLLRKNDAATEEQTEAINFYFPLKCSQCPLLATYNSEQKKVGGRELRPVEIEGVIRKAREIIEKTKKDE